MVYNGHLSRGQRNGHPTHQNHEKHVDAIENGRDYLVEARFGQM